MQTKAIQQKIKSTGSIKKITRTMEMVSVAKMKKAIAIADGCKPFLHEARRIIAALSGGRETHPLSATREADKELVIVVAGQKGLCGAYNTNVFRQVYKTVSTIRATYPDKHIDFISIGKYAEKIARKFGREGDQHIIASFIDAQFAASDSRVITGRIASGFLDGIYSAVHLVYTDFTSVSSQRPTTVQLLPFNPDAQLSDIDVLEAEEYLFEPDRDAVYHMAVRVLLENMIVGSVERARAAEHASRMMAMKTATDNASEMLGELKLYYNKVRQAAITQEIAEISSGAIALNR